MFTKAAEQWVKHMLAVTVRGRQLRPGWLQSEFCGMLLSLKLSQIQIQKQNNGTKRIPWWRQGEEEAALSGWSHVKAALSQNGRHSRGHPMGASFSLSTHCFPAGADLHPEPWSSRAGGTLIYRAPIQAVLSVFGPSLRPARG